MNPRIFEFINIIWNSFKFINIYEFSEIFLNICKPPAVPKPPPSTASTWAV